MSSKLVAPVAGITALAAALTFAAVPAGADSVAIDFEAPTYVAGDVNGQDGWFALANSPTAGTVVAGPDASLALTHVPANTGVSNGLNSPLLDGAGESGTLNGGLDAAGRNQFTAALTYRTPATPLTQAGTFIELNPSFRNPDQQTASRYAQAGFTTNAAGEPVLFSNYPGAGGSFPTAGTVILDWDSEYHLAYDLRFVDGLAADGGPNDTFCVTIADASGVRLGTIASWSWEAGYVPGDFGGGTGPRLVNGLDLLTRTTRAPHHERGHVDEVTMATGTAPTGVVPPADVNATVSGTTATVTWEAPNVDACTVITGYSVTNDQNGTVVTVGPGATSATVDGLETGTTYTFTVTVTYASGESASAEADPVTVDPPPPTTTAPTTPTTEAPQVSSAAAVPAVVAARFTG